MKKKFLKKSKILDNAGSTTTVERSIITNMVHTHITLLYSSTLLLRKIHTYTSYAGFTIDNIEMPLYDKYNFITG